MKPKAQKYFYPVTPKTVHDYAAGIFKPIKRGECVTTVWVPMAGRRMWNKFIIENIGLFKKELPTQQNCLLIYVEPLDLTEESLTGYLRLMGNSLIEICRKHKDCKQLEDFEAKLEVFNDEETSYTRLLEHLKALVRQVVEKGLEVIFFLGEFDELGFANRIFYNNLKSLWDSFSSKVHYVFLVIEDLTSQRITDRLGELNAVTLQNVVYVPLCQDEDVDYLIDFFSERLGVKFREKERQLIKKICGGHPYMIKAATRIMAGLAGEKAEAKDLERILSSHYEMLSVARRLFNLRSEEEKEIFNKIALGEEPGESDSLERLVNLGLIKKEEGKYQISGELLRSVAGRDHEAVEVVEKKGNEKLYLNGGKGAICLNGVSVEEKFTTQEYNVIKIFLESGGGLKSRDEISQILWGEESYEKYSDWAIDQLMSKTRKKLKDLGTTTKLVTLRGRGYKLITG